MSRNLKSVLCLTGSILAERPSLALHLIPILALGIIALAPFRALGQGDGIDRRLERSAALIAENRTEEAEQELRAVLRVAPNQAQALNLLGTIRGRQNKLDEAEALFRRALGIDGQLASAHMNLALLYMLKGMPEKTISELKEVLRLDPGNTEAAYKLARLLLSQGHTQDCIDFVEKARQSQHAPPPFLLAVLGDAYLSKANAEKAEENYLLALNQQSDFVDAILGLAQVSGLKGDARTTALYLSRAKELAAGSPELLYKFAVVALKLQAYDDARSALEQSVKLAPGEPGYWIALGAVWLKKPDVVEAEQAFRRALGIQPDNAQGQMYLGYALLNQKRYPEARAYLEKSIKGDASLPEPFYYLGLIAQEQNEDQRAIQFLEKAVQLSPSLTGAHVSLGSTYLKQKNYPRAQQELEAAVKLNPNEAKAHYQLALLYARLKDQRRAQEEMAIVEKLKEQDKTQGKDGEIQAPVNRNPH
jgi:tetratricopeptide (TPR) repeat protein